MKFPNPFSRMSFTTPTIIAVEQTPTPYQIAKGLELAAQFNLTQPKTTETQMASFNSILSDIGSALKKFFTGSVAVATAAEPFIDQLFPGVATLYNTVLSEVAKAEAAAVAAGSQNGTGAQKLALVVQAVAAAFPQYTPAQLTVIINGVVAGLNAIPASTTPSPAV